MILEKNIFVIFSIALFSITSCVLPLESIKNFDEIKKIGKTELSSFNGNYRIESTDSFHMLSYVFMYKDIFDRNKMPTLYDYINITAIKNRKLKIKLFVNNQLIKTKVVSGKFENSSFNYKSSHLDFFYGFIIFSFQTNRLSLSKEGDLFLDNYKGAMGTFLLIPIPLSGHGDDYYGLKFKRIKL